MRRAVVVLLLLGLPGCSGGSVVAPPSGPPATELRIGMIDYRFQLSSAAVRPGTVTVVATNAGSSEHDVVLTEGGAQIGRSDVLPPGGQQTFEVKVAPGGPVHLVCSVPGHDAAGMHAEVAVAEGRAGQPRRG
jgi:plastocyanin